MRHRIFIAINLPDKVKQQLLDFQEKWPELPVRWVKEDNLHITLIFLGYLSNEELVELCKITKEVALKHQPFSISLNKVCYGPPKKMPPRMVWVEGEKSEELGKLQQDLENSLSATPIKGLESESRAYTPHITLGRIKTWEWKKIEPEERPDIEENISLSFEVNSIDVMESELKRGGAEYIILETCNLELET